MSVLNGKQIGGKLVVFGLETFLLLSVQVDM